MAVVYGMLSMKEEARADIQTMMTTAAVRRYSVSTLVIMLLICSPIHSIRRSSARA